MAWVKVRESVVQEEIVARSSFLLQLAYSNVLPVPPSPPHTLIKKKIKFSSYIRKFRMEQLQSHIWLTASHQEAPGICYLGDKPHSPNLSDLAECVILCTSWLPSPGKVYCPTVNIWVTLVELRGPILSAQAGHQLSNSDASEMKAKESFDNSVFLDIEAKRTPSLESKLFSKRSEHIR